MIEGPPPKGWEAVTIDGPQGWPEPHSVWFRRKRDDLTLPPAEAWFIHEEETGERKAER